MANDVGVAAVDRALSILDAFAEHDQKLTLAELSKRTKLYKSTVLRLTKSLEKFGYLRRSEDGAYRLGSKVLHLGSLYQRHFHTLDLVPPILRQMVDEIQEGASLYVRDGDNRVCLHRVDSKRAVRDSVHEGDRLPLTVGASGHVIRAFNGASNARYEQIRRDMYSASYGERDPETAAVACPVFGVGQQFIGALTISGPKYRVEAAGVDKILPVLFRHAIELTRALGGDPGVFPVLKMKRASTKRASRA
jgi:DNA-binding IclR family transcriptional regulator